MPDPITGLPTDEELQRFVTSQQLNAEQADAVRNKRQAMLGQPAPEPWYQPAPTTSSRALFDTLSIDPNQQMAEQANQAPIGNLSSNITADQVQPNADGIAVTDDAPINPPAAAQQTITDFSQPAAPQYAIKTQTTFSGISPESRQGIQAGFGQIEQGINEERGALQKKGDETYDTMALANMDAATLQMRMEEAEQRRQETITQKMNDYQIAKDRYMNMAVDPNKFYANMDTGNKVLAGISIALGALGSALTGKDNQALKIIDQAIQRDIAAQEANINKAGKGVAAQENMISMYRQLLGDDVAARQAALSTHWGNVARQLETIAAKYEGTTQGANALKAAGEARVKEEQATKGTFTKVEEKVPLTGPVVKGPVMDQKPQDVLLDKKRAAENAMKVKDLLTKQSVQDNSGPISGRMVEIGKKLGIAQDEDTLRANTASNLFLFSLVKAMSGAQVTDQEMARYEGVMASIRDNPENAQTIMNEFVDNLATDYNQTREAYTSNLQFEPAKYEASRKMFPELRMVEKDKKDVGFKGN